MGRYIHKSHNVSVLLYHFVLPTKYRRVVIDEAVDDILRETCIQISKRFEIEFVEIGTDKDHVHLLIQSVPTYNPTKIVTIVKSITARQIFEKAPQVKKILWGGNFWTAGYFVNTVGQHGNEKVIANYVRNQGREAEYKRLHQQQLRML